MYKKITLLILHYSFIISTAFAQLQIVESNDTLTAAQIVKKYFLGENIQVKNIQFKGEKEALGIFTDSSAKLGFDEGIILSTGLVAHIKGPNTRSNAGANFGRYSFMDEDMKTKTEMCDGAVLEFDFVPQRDSVIFDFVFGSEEYPEFVNKDFNDIFAFYLNRANPRGKAYNMGRLPNETSVMINNVNHKSNSEWYIPNDKPDMPFYGFIEFDGFTKTITAAANVIPFQTYHLKIIIADLGDCEYDSGVLLRAHSLSSLFTSAKAKKQPKPQLRNLLLNFDVNSWTLNPHEQWKVKALGDSVSIYRMDSIVIIGHTDSTGIEEENFELSQKRAEAVKGILAKRFTVPINIRAYGKGSSQPLQPNNTEENKKLNRRVDVLFYPKRVNMK